MHKIRKTYISTLIDNENININYIREQVGHADERTTYGNYCFNRKSKDLTEYDMEQALVRKSS
jgi:integrase